jgi:pantothenate kinase
MLRASPFVNGNSVASLQEALALATSLTPGPDDDNKTNNTARRHLVAIAGLPGSGKTTLAQTLCAAVNLAASKEVCIVVGLDGYHIPRSELTEDQLARRGAEDTFDVTKFTLGLQACASLLEEDVLLDSFDHAQKDPVFGDIVVKPQHKLILVEGLYLAMQTQPWNDKLAPLFTATWFLDVDPAVCQTRVVARHVAAGICADEAEAAEQWEDNDKVNGDVVFDALDEAKIDLFVRFDEPAAEDRVELTLAVEEYEAKHKQQFQPQEDTNEVTPIAAEEVPVPVAGAEAADKSVADALRSDLENAHLTIELLRRENKVLKQALVTTVKYQEDIQNFVKLQQESLTITLPVREEAGHSGMSWMTGDF